MNLVFLLVYLWLLGPSEFRVVAVIITLQSLAMFGDFRMSMLVGRDIAAIGRDSTKLAEVWKSWQRAEVIVTAAYICLTVIAGALSTTGLLGTSPAIVMGSVLLLWLLVLQNLAQVVLLNGGRVVRASLLQLGSALGRAAAAALVLYATQSGA